jgi:hypothetical protein
MRKKKRWKEAFTAVSGNCSSLKAQYMQAIHAYKMGSNFWDLSKNNCEFLFFTRRNKIWRNICVSMTNKKCIFLSSGIFCPFFERNWPKRTYGKHVVNKSFVSIHYFESIISNSQFYIFLKKNIVPIGFRKSYSVCGNFEVINFFLKSLKEVFTTYNIQLYREKKLISNQ